MRAPMDITRRPIRARSALTDYLFLLPAMICWSPVLNFCT
jgi:hypothetical protein